MRAERVYEDKEVIRVIQTNHEFSIDKAIVYAAENYFNSYDDIRIAIRGVTRQACGDFIITLDTRVIKEED